MTAAAGCLRIRYFGAIRVSQPHTPSAADAASHSPIDFHAYPDANGHFGRHGGRFVAET